MGAARAGALDEAGCVLRAGVAGDATPRASAHCGAASPEKCLGAADRDFESHHAASGHGLDSGGAPGAISAPAGCSDGRRSEERRVGKSVDLGGRRISKKKKKKKEDHSVINNRGDMYRII